MSFWTDEKLYKLVQLYSKFGNLWDRKHHCYDNLRRRYTSYSKILTSLSMPMSVSVSDVICKLKELRNIYVCELEKIEVASKAGCIYRPDHTWFGIMNEFLYDYLDADEKLAEFSSSEDGTLSSENISGVCHAKECCSDSNSASESESDTSNSLDPRNNDSLRNHRACFKPPKKNQAYFLRSPTVLRSTKMNTKYEFPRNTRASSTPVKSFFPRNGSSGIVRRAEDTRQCTELDVKMTSSDVSIKYFRTESVNGEEKCYKKNLKGPRCSTDEQPCFKNIKMIISKSGYTATELKKKSNEREDTDKEFWEMMSMLDLGVSCPLAKLKTIYSPNTSRASITSVDSLVCRNNAFPSCESRATCCPPIFKDINDEDLVEEKRMCKTSNDRFRSPQGCCSKVKVIKDCRDVRNQEETLREPCMKKMKVMCLGDGTVFDDNLLELLQDLSIKICPVDAHCASGNCSSERPDNVFDNFLSCKTCSSATRHVKEYEMDAEGSVVVKNADSVSSNREVLSTTEENVDEDKISSGTVDAATRNEESEDLKDDAESTGKPERDLRESEPELKVDKDRNDTDSTPLNTIERKKVRLIVSEAQKNYDVKVLLETADGGSSFGRDAIFHEAKKELREAGKLYNGGKYITHENIGSDLKNEEFLEFDEFGAEVATSLKTMGKQRAMKLKRMIGETLRGETRKKFS